jgi:hypothetical protein
MKIFNLASLIATGFICTALCSIALNANAEETITYAYIGNSDGVQITIPKCDPLPAKPCNQVTWEKSEDGQSVIFKSTDKPNAYIICPLPLKPDPKDIHNSYLIMEFSFYGTSSGAGPSDSTYMDQYTKFPFYQRGDPFYDLVMNNINNHKINPSEITNWGSSSNLIVDIYPAIHPGSGICNIYYN